MVVADSKQAERKAADKQSGVKTVGTVADMRTSVAVAAAGRHDWVDVFQKNDTFLAHYSDNVLLLAPPSSLSLLPIFPTLY